MRTWRVSAKFELETREEISSQPLPFVDLRPQCRGAGSPPSASRKPAARSPSQQSSEPCCDCRSDVSSEGPGKHLAVPVVRGFEAGPLAVAWIPSVSTLGLGSWETEEPHGL